MKRLIITLCFTLASLTFAQPRPAPVPRVAPVAPVAPLPPLPPMPPRWSSIGSPGIPAAVAQRLGISAEVVKKVRDQAFDANEQLIPLEGDLKKAQLELERALASSTPDEGAVMAKLESVNRAELQVRKNRMALLLRIRTTVGPATWEKLQAEMGNMDEGALVAGGNRREVRIIRRSGPDGELQTEEIQGP